MGMYTELIFGAELKRETPTEVITILKSMVKGNKTYRKLPNHPFFESARWKWLFRMGSYYFGIHDGNAELKFDDICKAWHLNTRSNLKNYDDEIEKFLDWIKPYISQGSGYRDFYAIVIYEESDEPTIYYLSDEGFNKI